MPTLTPSLTVSLSGNFESTVAAGLATAKMALALSYQSTLASGTGLGQADQLYIATGSVSSGTPVDLDLAGSLTNAFGSTITFARIKGIVAKNKTTTAGNILQIGAGSNPLSSLWLAAGDGLQLGPGGCFTYWDPSAAARAVTAGTADILRLAAAAGTIEYEIAIVGATA